MEKEKSSIYFRNQSRESEQCKEEVNELNETERRLIDEANEQKKAEEKEIRVRRKTMCMKEPQKTLEEREEEELQSIEDESKRQIRKDRKKRERQIEAKLEKKMLREFARGGFKYPPSP